MDNDPGNSATTQRDKPGLISGWWVFALIGAIMLAIAIRMLLPVFNTLTRAPLSDPQYTPATFDKEFCLVPRELIVSSGFVRDSIPALTDPQTVPGGAVAAINEEMHGKFLVSGDRVVGVEAGGEARAYPVSILNFHEVINDTLGGQPIAVTYSPWCDSVVVFSREVGGEVLEFGVSGELYNSNLLMYDRRPDGTTESLWSQLLMRAVTGPAAREGSELTPLHCKLVHWAEWFAEQPETSVVSLDTGYVMEYGSNPFGAYYESSITAFPIEPLPEGDELPLMARIAAFQVTGHWLAYVYDRRDDFATGGSPVNWRQDGLDLTRAPHSRAMDPPTLTVETIDGGQPPTVYSFWFAWHAMHPDAAPPLEATGR